MPPRSRPFRLHSTWLGVWCIAREHKAGVATVLRVKAEMAGADGAEPKCPKLMHQMMQEDGDIRVSGAMLGKADQPRSAIIKLKKLCHRSQRIYPGEDSLAIIRSAYGASHENDELG
jgi:hypothetical protein